MCKYKDDEKRKIRMYKDDAVAALSLNNKGKQQYDDQGYNKKRVSGGDEEVKSRALNLEEFLKKPEAKLDEVKKQIQFVKSKDQAIKTGYSFVKYDASEESDKPGNPLRGNISSNAWPPKKSQKLGSNSNIGILGFVNQLLMGIVSSTPGYINGFPDSVDGMDFELVISSEPVTT
ncbi:Hypothetical predicted protein, partial [Olea europaea subsp. europaea]